MNNEPRIYKNGNLWQKKVYKKMADYLCSIPEIKTFGKSINGNVYKHLLTLEQSRFNFITEDIYRLTKDRFNHHKAGDLNRVLTNTAASQPYCFNLIIYLQLHLALADRLFSNLLNKKVKIHHIEPEFTPNQCTIPGFEQTEDESIGDQKGKIGTDSDIAVFYSYENSKKGVLLIEFKFIESEFSTCTSYSEKEKIKSICDSGNFYTGLVNPIFEGQTDKTQCGYTQYKNWHLTNESSGMDTQILKGLNACPFRFGLNQLWRNMLLSKQVAKARHCNEFGFWVFSPKGNDAFLWKNGVTEKLFREILTEKGQKQFQIIHLETILDNLQNIISDQDKLWFNDLEKRYRIT